MKKKFSTELAYVLGIVLVAWGVVLMEKADFGVSMVVAPAYLLYRWLSPAWHFFTFGMAEYCLQAVLLLAMSLLLRRFRISYLFSFVTAVVYGVVLDALMFLGAMLPSGGLALRGIYYAAGMLFCAAGVSAMFHTYISPEVYELFVKEVSAHFGVDIAESRPAAPCAHKHRYSLQWLLSRKRQRTFPFPLRSHSSRTHARYRKFLPLLST